MFTQKNLWLCDNENSYIFEMSYDDIWQRSVSLHKYLKNQNKCVRANSKGSFIFLLFSSFLNLKMIITIYDFWSQNVWYSFMLLYFAFDNVFVLWASSKYGIYLAYPCLQVFYAQIMIP